MDYESLNSDYKEALFATLRSVLYNETPILPKEVDIEKMFRIAAHQNLFPLVFASLMSNRNFENTVAYDKYLAQFMSEFSMQVKKTEEFLELYQRFSNRGIYPVVVKGIICRQLYGEFADCRPSGDEDIFVKKTEFEEAAKILEDNGFVAVRRDISEKQIESLHHLEFERDGLSIELHSNLIDCRSELRRKMNSYFDSAVDNGIFVKIEGTTVKTLNHTDHFLFLIFHAFNHFILSGVGIRQMLDILLYYQKYSDEINFEYIRKALEDTKSNYFLSDMLRVGNKYLGFSFEPLCEEKDSEKLLDDMLCMGVFGNSSGAHVAAGQMTSAAFYRGNTLLKTIFPAREWLTRRFPELIEKPYLLPICWMKRWFLFMKAGKEKNLVGESMAVGKRRVALLKRYEVL